MDSAKAPCMLGIGCVGTETWTSFMVSESGMGLTAVEIDVSFLGVVAPLLLGSYSVNERCDESEKNRMGRLSFSSCRRRKEEEVSWESIAVVARALMRS